MTKKKREVTQVIDWELLHGHCGAWIDRNESSVLALGKVAKIEQTKFHRFMSKGQELPVGDYFQLCAAMAVNPLTYVTIPMYIQVPLKRF